MGWVEVAGVDPVRSAQGRERSELGWLVGEQRLGVDVGLRAGGEAGAEAEGSGRAKETEGCPTLDPHAASGDDLRQAELGRDQPTAADRHPAAKTRDAPRVGDGPAAHRQHRRPRAGVDVDAPAPAVRIRRRPLVRERRDDRTSRQRPAPALIAGRGRWTDAPEHHQERREGRGRDERCPRHRRRRYARIAAPAPNCAGSLRGRCRSGADGHDPCEAARPVQRTGTPRRAGARSRTRSTPCRACSPGCR